MPYMGPRPNLWRNVKDSDLAGATVHAVGVNTRDGSPYLVVKMPNGKLSKFSFVGCDSIATRRNVSGKATRK